MAALRAPLDPGHSTLRCGPDRGGIVEDQTGGLHDAVLDGQELDFGHRVRSGRSDW